MIQTNQTASPDDIDITALWRAVMDRKKTLLASSLGVGALTFLGLSLMTPEYTATTRLIIENDQSVYDRPTGQQGQSSDTGRIDKEAVISQVHVLRSHDLASGVIRQLDLSLVPEFNSALKPAGFLAGLIGAQSGSEEGRILRAFQKRLTVYPIKESRIIAVDMISSDPKLAADVANGLAQSYLAWQRGRQVDRTRGESESLGRQLEDLRKAVEKADFKLEKFRSVTGLYAGQNNITLNAQQLSEVNSQLSRAQAQRSEAVTRATQIRRMLQRGNVDAAPDVLRSQLIQRLLEQKVQVQRRLSELSATLLPRHPRMRQLIAERGSITGQIRREIRKIVTGIENEAEIAAAREQSLRKSLDQVRAQAAKTGNDQVRLTLLDREARSKRTVYEAMLAKFDEATSRSASRTAPVYARVVEKARATSIPSFPQKLPMTIFAMAATLLLGLAYVVTRALLNATRPDLAPTPVTGSGPGNGGARMTRGGHAGLAFGSAAEVANRAQASQATTAPAMTAMQAQPDGSVVHPPVNRQSFASVDDVAELLLARGRSKPGFRTMVTTAPGGGSALGVATAIAKRIADSGARAVILSGERFGNLAPRVPEAAGGFTDVINGKIPFREAVRHDKATGVDFVNAGLTAFDWSDTRNAETVNRILDNLDGSYDQVLIGAEPNTGMDIFNLIEGRFDQGVVSGLSVNGEDRDGMFLGFRVPEFHVATLTPAKRPARNGIRAQFATAAPALVTA